MSSFSNVFAKIIALGFGPDLLLWSGILILSVLYTVFLGRLRVLLYLIAIYVALGVISYAPFIGRITEASASFNRTIYFIIAFVVLFFALVRGVLNQIFIKGGYVAHWWQVALLGFFQTGLLASAVFSFLPPAYLQLFSSFTRKVFLDSWGRFIWFLLPIFLMAALAERKDDD